MSSNTDDDDGKKFKQAAEPFLTKLFEKVLEAKFGEIEIRSIKDKRSTSIFCETIDQALKVSYLKSRIVREDVYFGVNPRTGKGGKKENVHFLIAFHIDVDYGEGGHKKQSVHQNYEEALKAIKGFSLTPTLINHSGNGFHCYWVLNSPVSVKEKGSQYFESINRALSSALGGDSSTHNIDRILRVPGTFNFKQENNPREVKVVESDGPTYELRDLEAIITEPTEKVAPENVPRSEDQNSRNQHVQEWNKSLDTLPISEKMKNLIRNGNDGTYPSRSEADQAVITALVSKGISRQVIEQIFNECEIGAKYRGHSSPGKYLDHCIESARSLSDLSEEEQANPLFVSGAISKKKDTYHLDPLKFQVYMGKKHRLIYLEHEGTFFKYDGKCFRLANEEYINHLCQTELSSYRGLFKKTVLSEFLHFCIGDKLLDSEKARNDRRNYLPMQNGLFELSTRKLLPHTPDIFTTNLLPYGYDPDAKCSRWLQYLSEVFMGDQGQIAFIQEAVGYIFHKEIPTPAIFFLIGVGSNGKSVFMHILTDLIGEQNAASINLNIMSNERYLLQLLDKMANISCETPQRIQFNTNNIKAVVAGDMVTGREIYKQPVMFKPYAKHFLAMNETPTIEDTSYGMERRLYLIDFPKIFKDSEVDVHLIKKLKIELPGIFNWALQGYENLKERQFAFTPPLAMKNAKARYKKEMNSISAFTSRCLVTSGGSGVTLKNLYEHYTRFCESEGYKNPSKKSQLKRYLQSEGITISESTRHGNNVCVFGVSLIDPEE